MEQEYERNVISITDEEGQEYELEILAGVTYNNAEYLALAPIDIDDEEGELEVSILKSVEEDGEPVLCAIEDELELEAVYSLMMDQLYEENEEDA